MTALVDVDPRELVARVLADAAVPCITSSFQAECVVLTDIVREVRPDIPDRKSTRLNSSHRH